MGLTPGENLRGPLGRRLGGSHMDTKRNDGTPGI
jgi:hypothetical protein